MGAMASKYRRLITPWLLVAAIVLASFLWGRGLFHFDEAGPIFVSCACAYVCVYLHSGRRCPESMVVVAATIIFLVAYLAQAVLFLINLRSNATTLGDVIAIRSIFSLAALGAGPSEAKQSLTVALVGFIGILLPATYLVFSSKGTAGAIRDPATQYVLPRLVISNPLTLGYAAILCTIFFGFLRKYFGLESPAPSGLPMGIGGMINIASTYVGPNLLFAALFFALDHGPDNKARRLALISIVIGVLNYILFTSKMSLIFPVMYILLCQYMLGRRVVSMRTIALLGGIFIAVYPFLNLYRSAIALGIAPGDLIKTITDLYVSQNEASDIDRSTLQVAIAGILGRFVGYDPLLILLQASPYPGSLLDYILYGDLDKYLTYQILDFQDPMGYSPGFLGRFFYISGSYTFLLAMTAAVVFVIAMLVRLFWRGNVRQRFMAPLLLTYCIIFFTDGIRFELVRSLVLSSIVIYGVVRVAGKVRAISAKKDC